MRNKQKKHTADHSIPVRVTQAKNAARGAQEIAQAEDHLSVPREHSRKGDTTELEKLLGGNKKQDMSTFVQGNARRRLLIRIIIVLFILFGLAFAGFLYFTKGASKFGQDVSFTISASEQVASGEVITLDVEYINNENLDLKDVELTMQFPDGFTFQSSTPMNTAPNTWLLGDIDAHAGGKLAIKGQLVGDVGSVKNFSGTLAYTPSNFNYGFTIEASTLVTINTSALSLEVDAPLRVIPAKEFETKITYTNTSDEAIDGLRVLLVPPDSYTMTNADPQADHNAWDIESLDSRSDDTVSFFGSLSGQVGDQAQFQVKIGFVNSQGIFTPQTEKTFLVLLIKAGMTLEVKATTEQGDYVMWGQEVTYDVSYTNDGDVPLEDVVVTLQFDGETNAGVTADLIDWDKVASVDGGVLKDSSIVWTKSEVDSLASIKPGDTKNFTLTVPIVIDAPISADGDQEFHILSKLVAAESLSQDDFSSSDVLETRISTLVDLVAEARYYTASGEEVGSGSLPPEVGSKTTYKVYWYLTNTANDISGVSISAKLPSSVAWVDDAVISAGSPITYNPQTREILWSINRVPAGAGAVFPKLEASFSVSVTPTTDQEGSVLVLLNKSLVTARDEFVSVDLEDEAAMLTSDLPDDTQARDQGIVVAQSTP